MSHFGPQGIQRETFCLFGNNPVFELVELVHISEVFLEVDAAVVGILRLHVSEEILVGVVEMLVEVWVLVELVGEAQSGRQSLYHLGVTLF